MEDFERRYAGDRVPLSDVLLREKQSGVRSEWQSERVDSSEGSSKDVQVRWVGRVSHDSRSFFVRLLVRLFVIARSHRSFAVLLSIWQEEVKISFSVFGLLSFVGLDVHHK